MIKIIGFTAIRSDYDLLSPLYKLLSMDEEINFKLIVSGAHLSKKFGYTYSLIKKDKIPVLATVKTLSSENNLKSRIKSGAKLLEKGVDLVSDFQPDLMIYAGDREEVIVASLIGGYLEIPTMHFYGGDHVSDSHIDNPVRHATSKLSTFHMVSCEEHFNRIKKMGELKERIHNIGSVALDKFKNEKTFSKKELKKLFKINKGFERFAVLIFHPIPKERNKSAIIFENILKSLTDNQINAFVSYPNIDPGCSEIIDVIEKYKNSKFFIFYKNQPRKIFLSIYKNSCFIIGNSSSGILESASFSIPAINVGYRQTGRGANQNVIFCDDSILEINKAIEHSLSSPFQNKLKNIKNIYGDGNSSEKALQIIKKTNLKSLLFKDEDILKV
tara:strand:- start:23679 stop:24836 length:1158 start_codon:yes stop_codon:yes gene_type:complete